jgi:hypothetical protein
MTEASDFPSRRQAMVWALRAGLAAVAPWVAPSAHAGRSGHAALLHARAIAAFRAGRFSEAYGRFVALADLGDAEAARLALWMYQRGPSLFGSDWDATPDQLSDWTALATRRGLPPL